MPRLKMLRGPEHGLEIPLEADVITIGRGRKNDIIIQDNEVSREHCRLVRVLDDYEIQDRKSTNGTFVNGQKIDENGWLLSGQVIVELGDSITFEYVPTDIVTETSIPVPDALSPEKDTALYLVIEQKTADVPPETYVLDRVTITIGRDIDNDIVLNEPEVSRHHLRLLLTKDGYQIEDLNTLNGTHVNERRLEKPRILSPSDTIQIGEKVEMWYTDNPDRVVARLQGNFEASNTSPGDPEGMTRKLNYELPEEKETEEVPQLHAIDHGLEPNQLENCVFMLHGREDWQRVAAHLFAYLDKHNIPIWTDQYLALNSDDWQQAFEQAIAESMCMLAVISEQALEQDHVRKGLQSFRAKGDRPMIIMQYGDVDRLPVTIDRLPPVVYDPQAPEKTFRIILAELRKLLGQRER